MKVTMQKVGFSVLLAFVLLAGISNAFSADYDVSTNPYTAPVATTAGNQLVTTPDHAPVVVTPTEPRNTATNPTGGQVTDEEFDGLLNSARGNR